ncbi:MAG: hypothetical protein ABSC30_10865 [Acidimicrobiales bacterium]|jgi:hypothetical protein
MSRERMSSNGSWFDSSQVFSDTQRVDLFNDPPWEAAPDPSPRRASVGGGREESRWALAKTVVVSLLPSKRGQHSHKTA